MKKWITRGILTAALALGTLQVHAQLAAVKTNVLLWGNLTPNLSLELVTGRRTSLEGTVFYGLNKTPLDAQLKGAQAKFRYWISDRPMARSFVSLSVTGMRYLVAHKGTLHHGDAAGPGLIYGYALPLTKHFNLEFSAGVGLYWYREGRYPEGTTDVKDKGYNANGMKCMPAELAVTCSYVF